MINTIIIGIINNINIGVLYIMNIKYITIETYNINL